MLDEERYTVDTHKNFSVILTTHAIVGASVASLVPAHPFAAFVIGFSSHFALDAIPHWHYPTPSVHVDLKNKMNTDMVMGRKFFMDMGKIGLDALLGILLSFFIFRSAYPQFFSVIFWGATGGILPDALQFLYWKFRHEPIKSLQRFHIWIHAETDLDDHTPLGVALQVGLILLCVFVAKRIAFAAR